MTFIPLIKWYTPYNVINLAFKILQKNSFPENIGNVNIL